jgi:hypothetical protein
MKLKKVSRFFPVLITALILGLSGCSSSSKSDESKMNQSSKAMDSAQPKSGNSVALSSEEVKKVQTEPAKLEVPSQMVIYQADLRLRVKRFEKTLQIIEEKVDKYGGYIADSNVNKAGKEQMSGSIKLRVPQKHFQAFLHEAEGLAAEVIGRDIKGQDVTEEYVDLSSRLKSKRVVEERLTTFMKDAAKTEDLLKISADLATVQEEIETIEGKMKFLENQTSLSTINITLYENKVIVPNLEKDNLNTWEKTKKQFMKSTNVLLGTLSGLVVFLIGNLPIIIILSVIGISIFFFIKKVKKVNRRE